ncbi:amine oxidase, flavin-containing superfamily [Dendryphion nanum]|uniref:Amine oxidase, flavin-containing superfamily n=1 Tax=Dendryphion nanum TaxID=256645 RepID=A0A9P9EJL7_9PLEO|nr:amine oxidase, flavin-containing superfamily [Dendryphion nanum]
MRSLIFSVALWSQALSYASATNPEIPNTDPKSWNPADIIEVDVAIIGGGSAGTYAAISLKDQGKKVIVIEKKNRIGGHTETYIDPETGTPIDMGVLIWHNTTIVRDYFKRFDIPLIRYGSDADPNNPPPQPAYYDLGTGKPVTVVPAAPGDTSAAFAALGAWLAKYPQLNNGLFVPEPVPEDLLLPFGKFVEKYNLQAALPTIYNYNPGLGDVLTGPTFEQIRVFGLSLLQQLATGFLTTARHNNSELYTRAQSELLSTSPSSLLLCTTIQTTHRTPSLTTLVVRTSSGLKLIHARRLLVTTPPKTDLLPFTLTKNETSIFSRFVNGGYYTSIVRNTGLPDSLSITNALQSSPYNLPVLPAVYTIQSTPVPGLKLAYYGTPLSSNSYPISDRTVQTDIINAIKTLQKANPDKFNQTDPQFEEYSSHSPFYLQAKPEDTRSGFYKRLYALQGVGGTWWTGASWRAQDSSEIWRYTAELVLPKLLAEL